ncbi:MAG: pirin family protein [Holophaga sp.]|nr:pirin family protein [Holophaga sp.]
MITLRPANERGHFNFGWLDTWHSFSFGDYYDPRHQQFRALRVINEDWVAPGQGFGTHGHKDMEIFTWVLEGALEHQDSLGTKGVIRPGEAQVMSAGSGIRHSEFNASAETPVHLLQIWILPQAQGLAPRYDQVRFEDSELRNQWKEVASPSGVQGSIKLFQDVHLHVARMDAGVSLQRDLEPDRHGWMQVARGSVELNGTPLKAGDGAAIENESPLAVTSLEDSEVLFFDLA